MLCHRVPAMFDAPSVTVRDCSRICADRDVEASPCQRRIVRELVVVHIKPALVLSPRTQSQRAYS